MAIVNFLVKITHLIKSFDIVHELGGHKFLKSLKRDVAPKNAE
jgi:hypothetical protein